MSELKGRHVQILFYLLERRYPVPSSQLCREVHININTLRKDLPCLREFLSANGLELMARPNVGLQVVGPADRIASCKDKVAFLATKVLGRRGKIWFTAELFLSPERIPTIEDLCEVLDVSRPTAVEYIHEVKGWLAQQGVRLCSRSGFGYYLEAKEENIRDAAVEAVRNFLGIEFQAVAAEFAGGRVRPDLLRALHNMDFTAIRDLIREVQAQIQKKFADEDALLIAVTIAISVDRIRAGCKVDFDQEKILTILLNPATLALKNSIGKLEDEFHVRFPDAEIAYLALRFISAKTQEAVPFDTSPTFRGVAEEIVALASELVGLPMNAEDELVTMLAHHLESAVAKAKIGARSENAALPLVQKKYPVPYSIAERASRMLEERFGVRIPEEETGYIAIYIAVFLEKLNQSSRKKVALVCPMGVITSKLLHYKLASEIPEVEIVQGESVKELEEGRKLPGDVDFVISTVPLTNIALPYVIVSPFLGAEDRRLIKAMLKGSRKRRIGKLADSALDDRLILLQADASSQEEVMRLLGNTLVRHRFARGGLVESVLAREREYPTGINTAMPFAIPHTEPGFTLRKGVAIATLKHPVSFREMGNPDRALDVSIVLMPVLTEHESDEREFYRMLQLLEDSRTASALLQSRSPEEIRRVLKGNPFNS